MMMSDAPLGRFASRAVINRRYDGDRAYGGHLERELSYAKENLIRATLDKLPEDRPFVFRYNSRVRKEPDFFSPKWDTEENEVHTLEIEIMPVETMRITMPEYDTPNTRLVRRPITEPESFWDKAKSWCETAQKGMPYED